MHQKIKELIRNDKVTVSWHDLYHIAPDQALAFLKAKSEKESANDFQFELTLSIAAKKNGRSLYSWFGRKFGWDT